ncbi:MAG: hypothetical protein FD167_3557 [bacterium]|nr:MAG: hypothetical protein FD167_3557 [bacterium]
MADDKKPSPNPPPQTPTVGGSFLNSIVKASNPFDNSKPAPPKPEIDKGLAEKVGDFLNPWSK